VSRTKELGFWDNLHTKYSGCRVGDYLQLQTKDEPGSNAQQPGSSSQQLPICEAIPSVWSLPQELMRSRAKPWSASTGARLLQSKDCGITQTARQLQPSQNVSTPSAPAAAEGTASVPAMQAGESLRRVHARHLQLPIWMRSALCFANLLDQASAMLCTAWQHTVLTTESVLVLANLTVTPRRDC
jgi:hypothetical protein